MAAQAIFDRMAKYHFEASDGPLLLGVTREVASLREAKFEAVRDLEDLLRDVSGYFWDHDSVAIVVTNLDTGHQSCLRLNWTNVAGPTLRAVG